MVEAVGVWRTVTAELDHETTYRRLLRSASVILPRGVRPERPLPTTARQCVGDE
jgi:hypothetical protein